MKEYFLIISLLIISSTVIANEKNNICEPKNRQLVTFSKVKNLDDKTKQIYFNDILSANIDFDNDGNVEEVYKIKMFMRGVKCWGELFSFKRKNKILEQEKLNVKDLWGADFKFREHIKNKLKSDPKAHKNFTLARSCVLFEPFSYKGNTYISVKGNTYVSADSFVFMVTNKDGVYKVDTFCTK